MSTFQRTIKYLAMGFAVFLSVCIISSIAYTAIGIISLVTGDTIFANSSDREDYNNTFDNVESIKIENVCGDIIIKSGDVFKVTAKNVLKNFNAEVKANGTLDISEEDNGFLFGWFGYNKSQVTIYLPEDFIAEKVNLESGAGKVDIDGLNSKELIIDAGAGRVKGRNMKIDKAIIDGGVGSLVFNDVVFKDADIECGLGEFSLDGKLIGKSKVKCGIGEIRIDIDGDRKDYELIVDSGIGSIKVDGKKLSRQYESKNNANHTIDIDGGIGSIKIDFND